MNDITPQPPLVEQVEAPSKSLRPAATMIYPLQYLRAFAAFSVVLCHASYYVGEFRGDNRMWAIFDRFGGFGVALFFAISGYLMAQLAETTGALRFLVHRLIRIYPIFWLCVAVVVAINLVFGKVIRPDLFALLLVPGMTRAYLLGVEWTLPFELTFYLIVFALIAVRLKRQIPIIAVAWIAIIELFYAIRPGLQQGQFPLLLHVPFSLFSLPFAMGLLVPYLLRKRLVGPATPLIGVAAIIAYEAMVPLSVGLSSASMGLGCTLLVATAVKAGSDTTRPPNRPLLALGDWSYALYLCHVPIIMAFCRFMPVSAGPMQIWFAAIGLPLVVAAVAGKIDLAMYRRLKSWVDRSGVIVKGTLCGAFLVCMLGTSAFAYVRAIQQRSITNNLTPLGSRITALMGGDESKLTSAVQQAGLQPSDALKGHLDGVYSVPKEVRVQGWALDMQASEEPVRIMVFHCGVYTGPVFPTDSRPDVAASLHIGDERSGFNTSVPANTQCASTQVDALVLGANGRYAILTGTSH